MWTLCKILKGSKGYTLTEMAAVVATAGVLTAVMLPVAVSQVQQGRITAAGGDVQAIGAAVTSLLRDTGDYPMRGATGNGFAARFAETLLLSTDKDGTTKVEPEGITSAMGTITSIGTFEPHFYTNTLYSSTGDQIWRGPYLSSRKLDPWGNSYLIFLEGIRDAADPSGTGSSTENLLILSAGPNGVIETDGSDSSPEGDDIMTVAAGGST